MNHSSLENVKPEPQPNSEPTAQDISVSHAIGNTNVVGSTVYLMDCVAGMKHYPDKWFDLAIVDPPYGINRSGQTETFTKNPKHKRKHFENKGWDLSIPEMQYFTELFRVSKEQIIWGANYFTQYLPASMGWIFWIRDRI